jgi:hypothetical protein
MRLLVSIHDVAPGFLADVQELWHICRSLELVPALLVVPHWHGQTPLEACPNTIEWTRWCQRAGADILLHGERHDEVGLPRGVGEWMHAIGRTDSEGEFLTLGATAARMRIDRGLETLRRLHLDAVGFVPPAWLARDDLRYAVRDAGLPLTEDASAVWLTRRNIRLTSPVIRWSARAAWRAEASAMLADWRTRVTADPLLRVALHPRDLHHRTTRDSLLRTLTQCRRLRLPTTYAMVVRHGELGYAA